MMTFMRTIIELPEDQLGALSELCKREGLSRAEAIRRAVAAMLEQHRADSAGQAFGLWKRKPVDGVAYQRRMRGEWA
jgi:metal-responsive CopG/Arc/MetJ family transcriptional regulator